MPLLSLISWNQTIARPHIYIHLSNSTTTSTEMLICGSTTPLASPAKFVLAKHTGHVVTASTFLDESATQRTKRNIIFVLFHPTFQLVLHGIIAGGLAMPFISTHKAYFSSALLACQFFVTRASSTNMIVTAFTWAPSNKRILVKILLSLES